MLSSGNQAYLMHKILDISGMFLSIVGFSFLVMSKHIHRRLLPTLLSYSISNSVSTMLLCLLDFVDGWKNVYDEAEHLRIVVYASSCIFSELHFISLMWEEYRMIKDVGRKKVIRKSSFSILLVIWCVGISISGIFVGCSNIWLIYGLVSCTILSSFITGMIVHLKVLGKLRKARKSVERFITSLEKQLKVSNKWSNTLIPRILFLTYFILSLPWAVYMMIEAIKRHEQTSVLTSVCFLIYLFNFHIYGFTCVYAWASGKVKCLCELK